MESKELDDTLHMRKMICIYVFCMRSKACFGLAISKLLLSNVVEGLLSVNMAFPGISICICADNSLKFQAILITHSLEVILMGILNIP